MRYWLGEHLLEVYSVHQRSESELIEKEIIAITKKNDAHLFNFLHGMPGYGWPHGEGLGKDTALRDP